MPIRFLAIREQKHWQNQCIETCLGTFVFNRGTRLSALFVQIFGQLP
jgi:hypothetical protein